MTESSQNPPTPDAAPEPEATHSPGPEPGPPPGAAPGPIPGQAPFSDFRQRYVRPKQDRMVAGVCASIARATNTDPVLWRVLFAVFTLFGGIGIIAYLAGWLFFVEEGDTASPIEALFGRGQSSTSTALSIVLSVALFLTSAVLIGSTNVPFALLLGALVIGIVLLADRRKSRMGGPMGTPMGAPVMSAPYAAAPYAAAPAMPGPYATTPYAPTPSPGEPYTPPAPYAPHGPYAPGAYGPGAAWPGPPVPPVSPYPLAPPVPPAPRPPREKSLLARYTFFSALIVTGILAVFDLAGASISVPAYFAAPLAVVGLGLLIGTRFGRGYSLIALGVILAIGMGFSTAIRAADLDERRASRPVGARAGSELVPRTANDVQPEYLVRFSDTTLDLRNVDFTDRQVSTTIRCQVCDVRVLLPANVDVELVPRQTLGEMDLFGTRVENGVLTPVRDAGADGTGGGKLTIDLYVNFGHAEVTR
ncbi:MAG: PspC domain-containing protein [Longispora sp.]|nr:PspC domain-containing protein [Longispora sp. (in: high G+C Gram-positive bacteria)]